MTLYGPNWNGIYWEQNTTKGTDSLAAIIDSASPTATKTFKWIFIVSGNKEDQNFTPESIFRGVNQYFSLFMGRDTLSWRWILCL